MEMNGLIEGHYVEPFAGGAGVALWLLFSEYAKEIHINDIDKNIFSFWNSVLTQSEEFCRLIKYTPVTIDQWLKQREIKNNPAAFSQIEIGFATFFLNRTNHSGILNGGVIGGQKQKGGWKIDARYNKEELIERIRRISLYADRISLYNKDACDFIYKEIPELPSNTLVYLDPPYYVKGGWLYQNHYIHKDHENLAEAALSIKKQKWIMSYDNEPKIKKLYSRLRQEEFSLNYTAGAYAKGSEVMIFQNGLLTPEKVTTSKKEALS
jgi:DNA adenine methylase